MKVNKAPTTGVVEQSEGSANNRPKAKEEVRMLAIAKPKPKATIYILTSDQAAQEKERLSKFMGFIYPGHGKPSGEDMIIGGLRAISVGFARYDWALANLGRYCLAKLSDADGLNHAISKTSIPCRDHNSGFTVYRWSGQEHDQIQIFPVTASLSNRGLPLNHWNRTDLGKIVTKLAHVVDVDEDTIEKAIYLREKFVLDAKELIRSRERCKP